MPDILDPLLQQFCQLFPKYSFLSYDFNVKGMIALLIIGIVCGSVGSLVVGNRMAFFSDALAHCAFAGVALGLLLGVFTGAGEESSLIIVTLPTGHGQITSFPGANHVISSRIT